MFYQSINHRKKSVLLFFATLSLYHKANEEALSRVLRCDKTIQTFESTQLRNVENKHLRIMYSTFVFLNACHVLSQYNTWLRPLFI